MSVLQSERYTSTSDEATICLNNCPLVGQGKSPYVDGESRNIFGWWVDGYWMCDMKLGSSLVRLEMGLPSLRSSNPPKDSAGERSHEPSLVGGATSCHPCRSGGLRPVLWQHRLSGQSQKRAAYGHRNLHCRGALPLLDASSTPLFINSSSIVKTDISRTFLRLPDLRLARTPKKHPHRIPPGNSINHCQPWTASRR